MSDWLLVVDDDKRIRQVYERHFVRAGFEVRSAADLAKATDRLGSTSFDAVIVDVSLTPGGSEGLAIAAYLRHLRRTSVRHAAPVVVLTAYGSPEHAETAERLGVDVFLHEPVTLTWLETEIRARISARRLVGPPEEARHPGADLVEPGLRLLFQGLRR